MLLLKGVRKKLVIVLKALSEDYIAYLRNIRDLQFAIN